MPLRDDSPFNKSWNHSRNPKGTACGIIWKMDGVTTAKLSLANVCITLAPNGKIRVLEINHHYWLEILFGTVCCCCRIAIFLVPLCVDDQVQSINKDVFWWDEGVVCTRYTTSVIVDIQDIDVKGMIFLLCIKLFYLNNLSFCRNIVISGYQSRLYLCRPIWISRNTCKSIELKISQRERYGF